MTVTGYAVLGGLVGAGIVTGIGAYLAVRELQTPAFSAQTQTYAEGVATRAATEHIENFYGLTAARMSQFTAIGSRFSSPPAPRR